MRYMIIMKKVFIILDEIKKEGFGKRMVFSIKYLFNIIFSNFHYLTNNLKFPYLLIWYTKIF